VTSALWRIHILFVGFSCWCAWRHSLHFTGTQAHTCFQVCCLLNPKMKTLPKKLFIENKRVNDLLESILRTVCLLLFAFIAELHRNLNSFVKSCMNRKMINSPKNRLPNNDLTWFYFRLVSHVTNHHKRTDRGRCDGRRSTNSHHTEHHSVADAAALCRIRSNAARRVRPRRTQKK
jgi:hypothetical protein